MSPPILGVIGIVVLILLFATRMRVAYIMFLLGFLGFSYLAGIEGGISVLGTAPYIQLGTYVLVVIPLFILMGELATYGGLTKDIYELSYRWLGHLSGGLAIASTWACAALGAVMGSVVATGATMATVAIPEMRRYKYDPPLACAAVAAGGGLGGMIPPSVPFILYAMLTGESVGKLFISGIFPGLLLASLLSLAIYLRVRLNPSLGPPAPSTSFKEKLEVLPRGGATVLIFVVVIGGIYMGVFTPSEAAAAGGSAVLLLGLMKRKITWQNLFGSLRAAVVTSSMVMILLAGALVFSRFLAVSRLPFVLADFASGLAVSPYVILLGIIFMYMVLGCLIEVTPLILFTVPITYPIVVTSLGFNPIWFGVMTIMVMNLGSITPPVGVLVYIVAGTGGVPINAVFRAIIPMILAEVVCIGLLIVFPQIAVFLPNLMF